MSNWVDKIPFNKEIVIGLIIALATLVFLVMEFQFGLHDTYIKYYFYIAPLKWLMVVGLIWYAIHQLYIELPPGQFFIKDGLMRGAIISVVAAFGKLAVYGLFLNVINPDFLGNIIAQKIKVAIMEGDNAIRVVQEVRESYSMSAYLIEQFTTMLFLGLFVSLLVSYRLMKQNEYKQRIKKAKK
ncbi:MAG: DUF4199 domain-containing protein [Cytophagaceae bacterium]